MPFKEIFDLIHNGLKLSSEMERRIRQMATEYTLHPLQETLTEWYPKYTKFFDTVYTSGLSNVPITVAKFGGYYEPTAALSVMAEHLLNHVHSFIKALKRMKLTDAEKNQLKIELEKIRGEFNYDNF